MDTALQTKLGKNEKKSLTLPQDLSDAIKSIVTSFEHAVNAKLSATDVMEFPHEISVTNTNH